MQAREYSAGTIEKYLRDVEHFFRDTGAPDRPDKQTVAAWRDNLVAKGYFAASVNAMLAAVNGYQEFCGNPQGKAKSLKCQRRVFCDAGRELNRAEYFRLLEAARQTGHKRTLPVLQTLCATGIRVPELAYTTVEAVHRGQAAIRCKRKYREILLPARLCKRAGVAEKKVFPHNLRHLFARTFYEIEKISRNWRTCSVIPASRRHAFILWNPVPNTSACWNKCTFYCKNNESMVLLQNVPEKVKTSYLEKI